MSRWDVIERYLDWAQHEMPTESTENIATTLDAFAKDLNELAAFCRLGAGKLRGEDTPDTIFPQVDEDPMDTARWAKWRLS
jgi:hypothetical protein